MAENGGYTRIPNEILEALARAPLSAREHRVVLAVVRQTYGWNRTATPLSAYRLAQFVGVDASQRTKVSRTLSRLKARGILTNGLAGVGIQKSYDTWQVAPWHIRTSTPVAVTNSTAASEPDPGPNRIRSESDLRTASDADPKTESSSDPHKRKKDRKTFRATEHHQTAMRLYADLFEQRTRSRPDITARDGALLRQLLARHPADEVLALIRLGMTRGTRFMQDKSWFDLRAIVHEYNALLNLRAELEGVAR